MSDCCSKKPCGAPADYVLYLLLVFSRLLRILILVFVDAFLWRSVDGLGHAHGVRRSISVLCRLHLLCRSQSPFQFGANNPFVSLSLSHILFLFSSEPAIWHLVSKLDNRSFSAISRRCGAFLLPFPIRCWGISISQPPWQQFRSGLRP